MIEPIVEKKSKWRKVGIVFLILITLIVSTLAIAYGTTDLGSAASIYEQNKAAAEKAGMFFTKRQVDELVQVPDKDNGIKLVLETKFLGFADYDLTNKDVLSMRKDIDQNLQLLEQAVAKKAIVPLRSKDGFGDSLVASSHLSGSIKDLVSLAALSSKNNDLASAKRYLLLAARLCKAVDNGKSDIALMKRIAYAQVVGDCLRRMIPDHADDPQWLEALEQTLKILDQPYDLLSALKLDHYEKVAFVDMLKKEPIPLRQAFRDDTFPLPVRFSRFLPKFREASLSRIHEQYSGIAQRLPKDPYDFQQYEKADNFSSEFANRKGWSYAVVQELYFSSTEIVTSIRKEVSQRNTLMQAVEILKAKADPARGILLKGRFAIDFDGHPIRVKHLPKGWIIYSIWSDGVDDGGVEIKNGHGDFVVHLSRATVPIRPYRALRPYVPPSKRPKPQF